ncbi:MAG: serine--tRNA ligase [Hyphomicrobium sp.]|nr:MAG: serine--tRNA ligase [Hyphomicrobium sp.]PPC98505.1 MAG: serine--tRNA ligase [Hyphomicrobium sp.]
MHDIKWIRDNASAFDAALKRRGLEPLSDKLVALDDARKACLTQLQDAQGRRNAASKEIGKAKGAKDDALAAKLMAEVAALKETLASGEARERELDAEIKAALEVIPNLPRDDVPFGTDETGNVEVRKIGTPGTFDFTPKQHFELGEQLGMMDFEAAQKISGARFVVLKGALARLERALGSFMLDVHTGKATDTAGGYVEHNPPLLVKDHSAYGTGNLPKFSEDLFKTAGPSSELDKVLERAQQSILSLGEAIVGSDPEYGIKQIELTKKYRQEEIERIEKNALYLIPTAEVSLTNIVRESILDESQLPMRMTAWTPCFRSEAGAAGRDTRGMIRQHQFSKVELVSVTTPETSLAEHERMTGCAEEILKRLGLPFRTMLLCTGDMGFASQKTYDIEVWLPGQNAYREISSCSVCGDFQARRMDARYRPKDGGKPVHVHTLNGSGLAVGRTLVAVLENYQQADGSVIIPEVLRPYMGGMERISKA